MKPVIGITVDTGGDELDAVGDTPTTPYFWLKRNYVNAVTTAGGIPLMLPILEGSKGTDRYLDMIDGLLISGGDFDIEPSRYGDERLPQCAAPKPDRTAMEFALYRGAIERGMPVLGVCGGHQVIAVAHKGTLYQDVPTQEPTAIRHSQSPIPPSQSSHTVRLSPDSLLAKITGKKTLKVNSTHHQSVKSVGEGVAVEGRSPDGLIEAISLTPPSGSWVVGVQWHPEALYPTDEPSRKLFARFMRAREENTIRVAEGWVYLGGMHKLFDGLLPAKRLSKKSCGLRPRGAPLLEYYGSGAIPDDLPFGEFPQGRVKNRSFSLASDFSQHRGGVAVIDRTNFLCDDRSGVEVGGDKVGGGADDLHPALVRLPIGVGSGEGGEERMVYVDDAIAPLGDEFWRKYAHVAGKTDAIDPIFPQ